MGSMEMLHEIIAADRNARKEYDRAQRADRDFDGGLETMQRRMEEEAMQEARTRVETARGEALAAAEESVREEDRLCEEALKRMAEQYEAEKERCAEQMFRMVVGLDDP